jgi:hypothetical protein
MQQTTKNLRDVNSLPVANICFAKQCKKSRLSGSATLIDRKWLGDVKLIEASEAVDQSRGYDFEAKASNYLYLQIDILSCSVIFSAALAYSSSNLLIFKSMVGAYPFRW